MGIRELIHIGSDMDQKKLTNQRRASMFGISAILYE